MLLIVLFAAAAREPGLKSAAISVGWLLAIFTCVVVHELAHCFVARSRGAEVHEILIFPLGGISKLRHLPETPRDEFAIAVVGPLASIGLGVAAGAACVLAGRSLLPVDFIAGAWLARLAWLNIILGVFNLLPAFPLDGGRVLRSLLERDRDLETATRIATKVGHLLAGLLIIFGFAFDAWLALIGVFIYFGASAEEAATIAHARLRGHRVRELMRPEMPAPGSLDTAVDINAPLDDELLAALQEAPNHRVPVRADAEVIGTLCLEDVAHLVATTTRVDTGVDHRP